MPPAKTKQPANSKRSDESTTPPLVTLSAGPCTAEIALHAGGRLASLHIHDLQVLEPLVTSPQTNHPFGWGSYPMAPWAGRIRNGQFTFDGQDYQLPINMAPHAIHGTAYDAAWTHLSGGTEWAMLGLRLDDTTGWPFGGSVTQLIHLASDSLTQTITVVAGDMAMPVTVGWHPWFRRSIERGAPLDLSVDMSRASHLPRDSDFIPTGKRGPVPPRPWDDVFEGVGAINLRWEGALQINVEHDCEYVVIYDPEHAICVEPESGPPDAFTIEPENCSLEPGEVLERTVTWRWTMASKP